MDEKKKYKKYKYKYLKLLLFGGEINECFKLNNRDVVKVNNCNIKLKDGKIISILTQLKTNIFSSCYFELSKEGFVNTIKNNLKNVVDSLFEGNLKCYNSIDTFKNYIESETDILKFLTKNDIKFYQKEVFPIKSVLHVDKRIELLDETWKNHYGKIEKNLLKMPYDFNIDETPYWVIKNDGEIENRNHIYEIMKSNTNIIRNILNKME